MTSIKTQSFKTGLVEAVPISISTFVFGAIFGVVAVQAGLSVGITTAMSFISFAGAAQLSVLQLIGQVGLGTIFFTTFLLNARHLLYGISLSGYVTNGTPKQLNLLAFLLSDSMFALANRRVQSEKASMPYFIGLGLTVYLAWGVGTWIGATSAKLLGSTETFGLEFASTACFIILLVAELQTARRVVAAILCTVFVLVFVKFVPTGVLLLLAGLVAFSIGYFSKEAV